jgi:hypothetical protein
MGAALLNETTPSGEAKIRLAVHCTGRRSAGDTIIYQQHTGGKQANSPSVAVIVERRSSRPGLSTVVPRPMARCRFANSGTCPSSCSSGAYR